MRKVFAFITSAFGIPGPDGLVMFAPLRAAFELGTVLLLGISALILIRRRYPVWLSAAVLFTGISLFFWAAVCPVTARDRSKHVFAEE